MGNLYTNFIYTKLDFNKILEEISSFSLCDKGKEEIINTIPENDHNRIIYKFNILNQLIRYFIYEDKLQVNVIYNFKKSLDDSKRNIIISETSLFKLSYSVKIYFLIQKKLDNIKYPDLKNLFQIKKLEDDFYLEVLKYIDIDGNLNSNISKELKTIRHDIDDLGNKIKKTTESFFQTAKKSNYTSEDIISFRDGFNCIAIKSSYKNKLDGIVLDSSSTGQTVFIVPHKVIELHNELVLLKEEEKKEIRKILQAFTERINNIINDLETIDQNLIDFDIFYSKARFSINKEFNIPEIIKEKKINILSGKHPLLGKDAVPLDIKIGDGYKIIIITGPNTGGKTVVLKTIGLFILMLQSGIPIPASSSSQFYIFNKLFIDIGDEQSIEQSLSTFSAHIKKIIEVIKNAGENSMILLDEFCAGTDPTEGSALAISLLKKIIKLKSLALVTTHYSALKYFAAQNEGVENASMEFNSDKLIPTYKLQIGVPGSSKALEISKRVGMPEEIIEEAKKNLNEDYLNIEKISTKLENEKKELEIIKNKLLKDNDELSLKKKRLLIDKEELEKREIKLNEDIRIKESIFFKESRKEFEKIIMDIKTKNASKESIKEGKSFLEKINENITINEKKIKSKKIFKINDEVIIISKDIKGVIIDRANKEGEYLVKAGLIKMNFDSSDLELIEGIKEKKYEQSVKSPEIKSQLTLDLRGCRYEEAEKKLDKFIENSLINSISSIKVIHGKGTGVLRKCIHEYFDNSPYIMDYNYEKFNNSTNFGVTIAILRK